MCTPNKIVNEIFIPFQSYVNAEQDIREVGHPTVFIVFPVTFIIFKEIKTIMKGIETPLREIVTILQVIHHDSKCEESNIITHLFIAIIY